MVCLPSSATRFIGCDVGKKEIVVFDSASGKTRTLVNHLEALGAFARSLDGDCLVLCEATGGYEAPLLAAMLEAGVLVHRADARKVKAFIRSHGGIAKTDAIDAKWLARFARDRREELEPWQARDPERLKLQSLVSTRRDLVQTLASWKNRRAMPGVHPAERTIETVVRTLEAELASLEKDIATLIKEHRTLSRDLKTLATIKGIGTTTASELLATMPELGTLNRRSAASLAGLAPHPKQSGERDAYRKVRGGREKVRPTLFMAALSASRYNPQLKPFHDRLIAKGKKPIVALVAVMRKLITIANAVLRPKTQTLKTYPI
ncbi:MAG: IS110 family transposase [Beijerinckiaceae bacterium]